ncbi:MAG: ribosome recycling factor [Endomicrobium sp.]|jgi:ribosome recycling factor|nr:ribosome recycling factor [Endomicrobium sp.]
MLDQYSIISVSKNNMEKTIKKLNRELTLIKIGKADSAIINNINVEINCSIVQINKIASVNIINIKTIEIIPWDISHLKLIEKAIIKSDLGFNPIINGKVIRIFVPPLNENKRQSTIKYINKLAEECKIIIRNERRDLIEKIRKLEKSKFLNKDEKKRYELESQKLTDHYTKKINDMIINKEKEITFI